MASVRAGRIGKAFCSGKARPWREASSLIIAAPSNASSSGIISDYSLLYLKRTSRSSFPNAYVYPGGGLDNADRNPKWILQFSKYCENFISCVINDFFLKSIGKYQSDLFLSDTTSLKKGAVPNEIAFRICAIREAFEESGLLLLTSDPESEKQGFTDIRCKCVASLLSNQQVEVWRKKVRENAEEFFNLCVFLNMVPDIWSLKEWSQWLTPAFSGFMKSTKRFDTVFYCCCLREMPSSVSYDAIETTEYLWKSPAQMIEMFLAKKAHFFPPQIIENMRLLNFTAIEKLNEYIYERSSLGIERWTPYIVVTKDLMHVELLPGDAAYPEDFDESTELTGIPSIDLTYEQLKSLQPTFRMRFTLTPKDTLMSLSCTAKLRLGQISTAPVQSVLIMQSRL